MKDLICCINIKTLVTVCGWTNGILLNSLKTRGAILKAKNLRQKCVIWWISNANKGMDYVIWEICEVIMCFQGLQWINIYFEMNICFCNHCSLSVSFPFSSPSFHPLQCHIFLGSCYFTVSSFDFVRISLPHNQLQIKKSFISVIFILTYRAI